MTDKMTTPPLPATAPSMSAERATHLHRADAMRAALAAFGANEKMLAAVDVDAPDAFERMLVDLCGLVAAAEVAEMDAAHRSANPNSKLTWGQIGLTLLQRVSCKVGWLAIETERNVKQGAKK